ncbi:MAG TPA: UDP-glucose/GDP-mannose dehydrogenase family protein [Symbiobacteriaceae bacterium]|nr:UDP-glucose/GDP-mannose dehydrogenase family protein [Symbiobacteriaceae bacterium]
MRAEGHIAIAGAGYVGLTSAACFCEMGHRVQLVEVDPGRLAQLRSGICPIFEPGLPDLLRQHLGGRLTVTDQLHEAVMGSRALFVCVGTPPRLGGSPDLRALKRLLRDLRGAPGLGQSVVVLKSTVPPGTNRMVYDTLGGRVPVVSNPEFLREGTAIYDFFHPDRVVVGSPEADAALSVAGLYVGIDSPMLVTGWEEAELIKYATNAFLAVKISFANEMATLCEALGAEAPDVLKGLGLDHRVGPQFLRPGPGYGGSCLPKDIQALAWKARKAGVRLDLLHSAERANRRQRMRQLAKLEEGLGGLAGKTVAVWGLAFKAGTDDLRGAAAVDLVPRMLEQGARVRAHDPAAMANFARLFPREKHPGLTLVDDPWEALLGADALLILTEWDLYRAAPLEIRRYLGGKLVVDSRNLLDPDAAHSVGLVYNGIGRGRSGRK